MKTDYLTCAILSSGKSHICDIFPRWVDARFIPARAGNGGVTVYSICRGSVHPRSRGERRPAHIAPPPHDGSSPLARGTGSAVITHPPPARFIPARAGNGKSSSRLLGSRPVHPRSRGERITCASIGSCGPGSSPLARGTVAYSGARYCASRSSPLARGTARPDPGNARPRRFIPARAGNGPSARHVMYSASVHPRSRGERQRRATRRRKHIGSSPLARGTEFPQSEVPRQDRFIPARAGNGRSGRPRHPPATVHPRSRGERGRRPTATARGRGSSPLARGTGAPPIGENLGSRFIPARAGNGGSQDGPDRCQAVHPRSRGERAPVRIGEKSRRGSSPLARGTELAWPASMCRQRFIPARAGNGLSRNARATRRSVHPRSRGERVQDIVLHMGDHGSSPLARGTAIRRCPGAPRPRFIPARAGNGI